MATSWPTWDCHRSGRLTYRPVGDRGERYPEWLQRLRGSLGVYIGGEFGELLGIVHGHAVVPAAGIRAPDALRVELAPALKIRGGAGRA